jgi:hypothetical protein
LKIAGPYVENLLGMDDNKVSAFTGLIPNSSGDLTLFNGLKPGFIRLNLPWFATDEEIDYIFDALEIVCNQGKFLYPKNYTYTYGIFNQ